METTVENSKQAVSCLTSDGVPEPVEVIDNNTNAIIWFVFNEYEQKFLNLPFAELNELLIAASYLKIPSLQSYSAQAMARKIREVIAHPQKVRDLLGLPDNLTKEEKEQIKKDNPWCDFGGI
uniref:SKP1 component dimerisation domain-containing protein n=1 Tax=Ditylenchus dipsaci TaxID=166011 RepID=A0A915ECP0_9BILA